jgi:uncharacterized protein YutE (UPF0331/DUF86 family)
MERKEKLENFMKSFAASVELSLRTEKNGSFIEGVCLIANQIDALLRIGLILKNQLEADTADIIEELLYQGDGDKIVSEKNIYDKSFTAGIIDQEIKDKLYALYTERNKVVHRYIISEITTKQVLETAIKYHELRMAIKEKIAELEKEQIRTGKGMTLSADQVPKGELHFSIKEMALGKHGGLNLDLDV